MITNDDLNRLDVKCINYRKCGGMLAANAARLPKRDRICFTCALERGLVHYARKTAENGKLTTASRGQQ